MAALSKQRLETFTDGVVAIIITLMVLDIHRPSADNIATLVPSLLSYALSAIVIGIIWVNHHNMFHNVTQSNSTLMWLNIHLLFWMSLIPLPTGMIGEDYHNIFGAKLYTIILAGNSLAYTLLNIQANKLMASHISPMLKRKVNILNFKSFSIYLIAFASTFVSVYITYVLCLIVPTIYFTGNLYSSHK